VPPREALSLHVTRALACHFRSHRFSKECGHFNKVLYSEATRNCFNRKSWGDLIGIPRILPVNVPSSWS